MKVLFEKKFLKNIDVLEDKEPKLNIEQIILAFENAKDLSQMKNLKKLKGHKSAYRLRLGEYRLGFFLKNIK